MDIEQLLTNIRAARDEAQAAEEKALTEIQRLRYQGTDVEQTHKLMEAFAYQAVGEALTRVLGEA